MTRLGNPDFRGLFKRCKNNPVVTVANGTSRWGGTGGTGSSGLTL